MVLPTKGISSYLLDLTFFPPILTRPSLIFLDISQELTKAVTSLQRFLTLTGLPVKLLPLIAEFLFLAVWRVLLPQPPAVVSPHHHLSKLGWSQRVMISTRSFQMIHAMKLPRTSVFRCHRSTVGIQPSRLIALVLRQMNTFALVSKPRKPAQK